jgi:LAO/AO transport system kinase
MGAVLGDRVRMAAWYNHPGVFIRSLASRGALGGLSPKIIEITEVLKAAGFDVVIIETVGVGQSEVEIAGLADITVVVMAPESGDEVQTMKAGVMEIADIFVINKADRPGADSFEKNLRLMLASAFKKTQEVAIVKTAAIQNQGIPQLYQQICTRLAAATTTERQYWLLAEKAYQLIQQKRMAGVSRQKLFEQIQAARQSFNLYAFVENFGG